jgi:hypothetical protein
LFLKYFKQKISSKRFFLKEQDFSFSLFFFIFLFLKKKKKMNCFNQKGKNLLFSKKKKKIFFLKFE